MARPQLNRIAHSQEGWDSDLNDNWDLIENSPIPIPRMISTNDETQLESTFAAAQYSECIIMVNHSTKGWIPYFSDGTNWRIFSAQMPHQANSTAIDVAGIVADFNSLLSKLQDDGYMASS